MSSGDPPLTNDLSRVTQKQRLSSALEFVVFGVSGALAGLCLAACVLNLQEQLVPLPDWNHVRPYVFWAVVAPLLAYVGASTVWAQRRRVPRLVAAALLLGAFGYLGAWLYRGFRLWFVLEDPHMLKLTWWGWFGVVVVVVVWLFTLPRDLYPHYQSGTPLPRPLMIRAVGFLAALSVGAGQALQYLANMVILDNAWWGLGIGTLCGLIFVPVIRSQRPASAQADSTDDKQRPSWQQLVFAATVGACAGVGVYSLILGLWRSIEYQSLLMLLVWGIAMYSICITGACIACAMRNLLPRGCLIGFYVIGLPSLILALAAHGFSLHRASRDPSMWELVGWAGAAGIVCGGIVSLRRGQTLDPDARQTDQPACEVAAIQTNEMSASDPV